MSGSGDLHVVPGEHVYDGVMYHGVFPASALNKVKTFDFRDDDTVLVTYPKSAGRMSGSGDVHVVPGEHVYDGVMYGGVFPASALDKVKTFDFRDDDTVLVTYPKSGTTWLGQIMHSIRHRSDNLGYMAGKDDSIPYLEMVLPESTGMPNFMDVLENIPERRQMKSHLEVKFYKRVLDTKNTKFVVVMRNVKDNLVSKYHFYRSNIGLGQFKGTFAEWMELYKNHRMQDWFDWNLGWWEYKDHPNVIFFKFEDLKKDLRKEVCRLVEFLGEDLTEEEVTKVCDKATFGSMSKAFAKNPLVNKMVDPKISPFIRKGEIGDWRNYFDDELNNYIDDLYEKRVKGTGLEFEFQ